MTTDNTKETTMLTRRQLITTAAAGGAALVATGLGSAAIGKATTAAQYEIELTKLRALVALYEQLEKVGLDAILQTGMNVVRGALDTIKGGVNLMRSGVTTAETALRNFQTMLDGLQSVAHAAEQVLNDLAQKFHAAEGLVIAVLGTALPLADSIAGFFNTLLDKIPFGVGDNIRNAAKALTDLVRAIPTTIDTLTNHLLKTLQDYFFPASGTPAVKSSLIDPITNNMLEPLKKLLDDTDTLVSRWEIDFTQPVLSALDQRDKIRQEIAQYKQQNDMT